MSSSASRSSSSRRRHRHDDTDDQAAPRSAANGEGETQRKRARRSRWADASSTAADHEAALLRQIQLKESPLLAQIEAAKRLAAASRMPMPLMVDEQGRQVDQHGKVVEVHQRDLSTVMANRPQQLQQQQQRVDDGDKAVQPELDRFVDPRIPKAKSTRKPRSFSFVEPGQHIRQAETMRMKQVKSEFRAHRASAADEKAGDNSAMLFNPNLLMMARDEVVEKIPDVEWWDAVLLRESNYSSGVDSAKITLLIEHPVPLRPRGVAAVPPPMPMMLTEKEKKKMRRMRKQEKQREKQDQIRLGLIPPPEPRMTLKNMTRVLAHQAIEDPTALEAKARAQMEKRQLSHHLHNESRRLTPQQRAQKKREKLKEDTSREVHVALFRIDRLDDEQNRFKVHVTADQYNLTGCLLLLKDCNIVVVEGGPKGIRKYTKLLTHRIPWSNDDVFDDGGTADEDHDRRTPTRVNRCHLVWKGIVLKRSFPSFRVVGCADPIQARKQLAEKNLVHYWDLCANFTPESSFP